jgi:hypothetical protein
MQVTSRRIGLWLSVGVITVGAWLVIGTGHDNLYLGPYVALGALACLAGWRGDRVAALVIYLGGIAGATAVAWLAGPVGVRDDGINFIESRSSYYAMLVIIAAAVAAVVGLVAVAGGYLVGRLARSLKPETSDPL